MSIIEYIKELFTKTKSERDEVLRQCGNVCYCPNCKNILNNSSVCVPLDDEGLYEYTCSECKFISKFHFGIAPVPIFIEEK